MPAPRLRWGLLSTAHINKALIDPLRTSKRNKVLAVASRSQAKADEYARKFKIKCAYGSYAELLADSDIDVIYNSLPNHLYAEWTIKAVQAGKHVLCEKPLALSLVEVDAISTAAEIYGRVVAEAFIYRSHLQSLKVKEIVAGSKFGKIKLVRGSFTFRATKPDNICWKPEMSDGSLWDVGCYPLSHTRALLGVEPLEVFGGQVIGPTGVDELFAAHFPAPYWNRDYQEDVYAQFDCSIQLPDQTFMEIIGREVPLNIPKLFTSGVEEKLLLTRGGKTETIVVKGMELYIGEWKT